MMKDNPFREDYNGEEDTVLIKETLAGSQEALVALISRHQNYIYNLAFKMVLSPYDAQDITQDVIIKIITKLSQFNGKSSFRTWVYRITVNHFLNMKKKWLEERYYSFPLYENDLDNIPDESLTNKEALEMKELIEEARLGCMAGMLLCLSREQRIVFILGEIFAIPHSLGSEMLHISKDNFRQRLARARHDLYQFMNRKCGLMNRENPCRCQKKTKGFIEASWVDPDTMKFNTSYKKYIYEIIGEKDTELKNLEYLEYGNLMREHPFQEKDVMNAVIRNIVDNEQIKSIFELSETKEV